jgi:phage terminase large subunit-like protein
LELDDWQQDVLRGAMAQRADDRWSAFEVGVIVTRQAGKGTILEARQLAGLFRLKERLQLHSAHEFKTCFEHFRRVKDLVDNCDLLRRQVKIIRTGAGDQAIELLNGCRLRFIARSRSSGRGFSGDAVYLDEAFQLSDSTMGALLPSLSARPNPQIWYTSSAPHADSEVLHRVRARGLAGDGPRLFFVEWSCEPDADPSDRENWYRANPALGVRIAEESVEAEFHALAPAEFGRERLGIPDQPELEQQVIPADVWAQLIDSASEIASHTCYALDVSPDRRWASFAAAGRRADGRLHVEAPEHRPGTDWVKAYAVELYRKFNLPIRIDKSGPAASFITPLREAGVEVVEVTSAEASQACGQFIDAALNDGLRHLNGTSLNSALRGAVLRSNGDAALWGRRVSKTDISALVAVTVAVGGVPASATPKIHVWNGGDK